PTSGSDAAAYRVAWLTRALVTRAMAARRDLAGQVPEARPLWEKLRTTRSDLARLSQTVRPASQEKHRQERLAPLSAAKEDLERQLAAVSEPFRRQREVQEADFTQLAARLPANAALVNLLQVARWMKHPRKPNDWGTTSHYEAFVLRR